MDNVSGRYAGSVYRVTKQGLVHGGCIAIYHDRGLYGCN